MRAIGHNSGSLASAAEANVRLAMILAKLHKSKDDFDSGCVSADDAERVAKELLAELDAVPVVREAPSPRRRLAETLWEVWQKTGGLCSYCGVKTNPFDRHKPDGFQVDHVMPRHQGGTDDMDNLVPSCRQCNNAKGPRTPDEWGGA